MLKALPVVLALLAVAAPARAQDETAVAPVSGNWAFAFGAATDNRSRSLSKSGGDPYIYGLAEWSSADGLFYAGPEFETIRASGSDLEVELRAGVRPQVAGFDLDLNTAHKWRLDANPGTDDDAWEFSANVSRSIGPAKARFQLQYSPDGLGSTGAWAWVEGRLGWDFTDRLEGTAAIGRREQDNAIDYTGWNAGLTWTASHNLELDLRWHDTDIHVPGDPFQSALVAGVNVYF